MADVEVHTGDKKVKKVKKVTIKKSHTEADGTTRTTTTVEEEFSSSATNNLAKDVEQPQGYT